MKGQVLKRGDSWTYRFDAGIIDGKRKRPSKGGFKTKKECENALRDAMHKYENGGYIEPKKVTFESFIEEYLQYIKLNRKVTTYNRYNELINKYLIQKLGALSIANITPYHIENMLQDIRESNTISSSTLQAIYALLNSILNRALKLKVIISNPCFSVDRPKREKKIYNTLKTNEINALLNKLDLDSEYDYMFYIALRLTIELGLRRGELSGLQWNNIDFDSNKISIVNNMVYSNGHIYMNTPKTPESIRTVIASKGIMDLLSQLKKKQAYQEKQQGRFYLKNDWDNLVMIWFNGHYIHPMYYTNKIKKYSSIRWHDLRHTNATLLLQGGVSAKIVQQRLGHKDISTTLNIYSHVNDDMQRDALEKLNNVLGL